MASSACRQQLDLMFCTTSYAGELVPGFTCYTYVRDIHIVVLGHTPGGVMRLGFVEDIWACGVSPTATARWHQCVVEHSSSKAALAWPVGFQHHGSCTAAVACGL